MGPTDCPETPVRIYCSARRHIQEWRRFWSTSLQKPEIVHWKSYYYMQTTPRGNKLCLV